MPKELQAKFCPQCGAQLINTRAEVVSCSVCRNEYRGYDQLPDAEAAAQEPDSSTFDATSSQPLIAVVLILTIIIVFLLFFLTRLV